MAKISPVPSRLTFSNPDGALEVRIPARKQWFVVLFISFWLVGWAMGWVSATHHISQRPNDVFMWAWVAVWTLGGAGVAYSLLWMLWGVETIRLTSRDLIHRRRIGPWQSTREFALAEVANFRVRAVQAEGRQRNLSSQQNRLNFDYGAKTFELGKGLDDAEATQIVAALERFRQ